MIPSSIRMLFEIAELAGLGIISKGEHVATTQHILASLGSREIG